MGAHGQMNEKIAACGERADAIGQRGKRVAAATSLALLTGLR
jgi:hypothetical protein